MRMNIGNRPGQRARGFTMVELLTVIAIVVILIGLVVGGFTAVKSRSSRATTLMMFRAIEAALQRYYADWGAYPYFEEKLITVQMPNPANPGSYRDKTERVMDTVATNLSPPANAPDGLKAMGILYAALNARVRNGPYMPGAAAQTVDKTVDDAVITLFTDGWGRPIMYGPPLPAANVTDGSRPLMPRLESQGADEFDTADNLKNYNYDMLLEDNVPYKRTN